MWRKGNHLALLVGMQSGTGTLEDSVAVLQEFENRVTLPPRNCNTGYLPQRHRFSETAGHLHPDVYSSNVHNSQTVEGDSVPINT